MTHTIMTEQHGGWIYWYYRRMRVSICLESLSFVNIERHYTAEQILTAHGLRISPNGEWFTVTTLRQPRDDADVFEELLDIALKSLISIQVHLDNFLEATP